MPRGRRSTDPAPAGSWSRALDALPLNGVSASAALSLRREEAAAVLGLLQSMEQDLPAGPRRAVGGLALHSRASLTLRDRSTRRRHVRTCRRPLQWDLAVANNRQAQFGTPGRGAAHMSLRGRVCHVMGCSTVLSVYNHLGICSVHEQPALRTRGNRPTSL
jgi:hypothetical protein